MKQYNYYIWYNSVDKKTGHRYQRESPLTIHDLKGDKIAGELIPEIISRLEEIDQSAEYNTSIELTNISLLNIHQFDTIK